MSIAYRRTMEDSPAYRLNHEEIIKALEEGISFIEGLEPQEAVPDEYGKLKAMRFLRGGSGETVELPARTLPRRRRDDAEHHVREGVPGRVPARREAALLRPAPRGALGRAASASSRRNPRTKPPSSPATRAAAGSSPSSATTTPPTTATSSRRWPRRATVTARSSRCSTESGTAVRPDAEWDAFARRIREDLSAEVVAVHRLTPTIVEVVVRAPAAVRNFEPGQFFRLQNLESRAPARGWIAPSRSSPAR